MDAFSEFLQNDGNELYLKPAYAFHCTGVRTVQEIRATLLLHGYIFLGYMNEDLESTFNPPLMAKVRLTEADKLIVAGID